MKDIKYIFIDPFVEKGGQEKFILSLCKYFQRNKHQSYLPIINNKSLLFLFYNEIFMCKKKFKGFKIINNSDRTYPKVLLYSLFFKIFIKNLSVYHIHHINFYDLKKYNTISPLKFMIMKLVFSFSDFFSIRRIFVNSEMKKYFKKKN